MEPIDQKEIRGISVKTAIAVFVGWSSLMFTIIGKTSSIESTIRNNKKDTEVDNKMLQYQIDNIKQSTELNSIQIEDLKNQRYSDHETKN